MVFAVLLVTKLEVLCLLKIQSLLTFYVVRIKTRLNDNKISPACHPYTETVGSLGKDAVKFGPRVLFYRFLISLLVAEERLRFPAEQFSPSCLHI